MNTSHRRIPLLILGAGMSGLGAGVQAQRSGVSSLVLEAESQTGGLCRSITSKTGCDFDFGPKILILDNSNNSKDILSFLGQNYEKYPMQESVYLKQFGLIGFPIQRNLIDLPREIAQQILNEVEINNGNSKSTPNTYKDWLLLHYGEYLTKSVLLPYEEKKWQTSLDHLSYAWAKSRPVSVPLEEMRQSAIKKLPPKKHYYYLKKGNIATLTQNIAAHAGNILLNHKVTTIDASQKIVIAGDKEFHYDKLISTLPLDYMLKVTKGVSFDRLGDCRSAIRQLDIRIFHLVFKGNYPLEGTAIYFPEKDFIFRRVSVLQNLCPALARNSYTPISVEVSLNDSLKNTSPRELQELVLNHLQKIDQFKKLGRPVDTIVQDIPGAYPLPLIGLDNARVYTHNIYKTQDIYLCGRGGNYDYCNCDIAYKQGKETMLSAFKT